MYNPNAFQLLQRLLKKLKQERRISDQFILRLSMLFQDLHQQYMEIYGEHSKAQQKFELLVKMMAESHAGRPAGLKRIDREREKNPYWYLDEHIAGMMLYTDRFAGNIAGLTEKLDYFEELGINLLHLMPLLQAPAHANDGGYAVSDYGKVDARLGSNKELYRLIGEMHKKGMVVMMDLVVNHTSDEHAWAQKARKGEERYQDYYYTFGDRMVPDLFEQALPEVFPQNAPGNFTWDEEMGRWVMTVFNSYQWDLNYTNPDVFHEMLEILFHQANWGVDIFRLDAVAFLWKKMGTNSQNLPGAHAILKLFKICAQIVSPGVVFVAEAIVAPQEIVKYFGESDVWSNECDIAYNASLMAMLWDGLATKKNSILYHGVRDIPEKPAGTTWINYLRCHDDIGLGYDNSYIELAGFTPLPHREFIINFYTGKFHNSFARGLPFMTNPKTGDARISGSLASLAGLEEAMESEDQVKIDLALKRILMLHGIILAWGGIPMIYYGDEIATLNDYSFLDDNSKMDDNRWVHRPVMDWKRAEKRHDPEEMEGVIFQGLKHMLSVRAQTQVMADRGNTKLLDCNNIHVIAIERGGEDDEKVLVLANLSPYEQEVEIRILQYLRMELNNLVDLLTGDKPDADEYGFMLTPYEVKWLARK